MGQLVGICLSKISNAPPFGKKKNHLGRQIPCIWDAIGWGFDQTKVQISHPTSMYFA